MNISQVATSASNLGFNHSSALFPAHQSSLQPSSIDAAQFRQLSGVEGSNRFISNHPSSSVTNKPPVAPTTSGDGEMLHGLTDSLQSISSGIREKSLAISSIVNGQQRPPTVSEMLKVQMDIAQLSLQTQWVGDLVSKAGKNIDQLTHLQ